MKLYVTKTNDPSNVIALAEKFFCKTEVQENEIIITKNSQLTDDEFSLLAGKLVMYGFNVVCQEVAEFNQRVEQVNREHEQRRKQTEKEYLERQTQKNPAAAVTESEKAKAEKALAAAEAWEEDWEEEYDEYGEEEYDEYGQYQEAIRAELEAESEAERAIKSHRY